MAVRRFRRAPAAAAERLASRRDDLEVLSLQRVACATPLPPTGSGRFRRPVARCRPAREVSARATPLPPTGSGRFRRPAASRRTRPFNIRVAAAASPRYASRRLLRKPSASRPRRRDTPPEDCCETPPRRGRVAAIRLLKTADEPPSAKWPLGRRARDLLPRLAEVRQPVRDARRPHDGVDELLVALADERDFPRFFLGSAAALAAGPRRVAAARRARGGRGAHRRRRR